MVSLETQFYDQLSKETTANTLCCPLFMLSGKYIKKKGIAPVFFKDEGVISFITEPVQRTRGERWIEVTTQAAKNEALTNTTEVK